jgi:signal transduction histidine kinase
MLHIEDNGIGISPEFKDKIFNMFFRATASSDGSGLGLYIVKQTLEKLEGAIQVESELNKGTTFILQLPNFINKTYSTAGNS